MNPQVITNILVAYGIYDAQVLDVQKGYRNESFPIVTNNDRRLNLIIFKCEPGMLVRIKNADAVSNYLHEQGFQSRYSADTRIIKLAGKTRTKYAALYAYLPGETIAWEAYTQKHLKLLGQTMSDMHHLLSSAPLQAPPLVTVEYAAICTRMERYFTDPQVLHALVTKLNLTVTLEKFRYWQALLKACDSLPNQQILHMDFVRSNILFDESPELHISGVLDFEKTAYGHPIFDIARTLAFLLVDCKYKTEEQVRKYFLQSGYQKRGKAPLYSTNVRIGNDAANLLDELTSFFLFYDLYKFLRHNPYESLPDNEHFVRTRDLLLRDGIIKRIVQ